MDKKEALHPSYYKFKCLIDGEVKYLDVCDIMENMGGTAIEGFLIGNMIKYIKRAGVKDPSKTFEDLEKAMVYLDKIILLKRGINESKNEMVHLKI